MNAPQDTLHARHWIQARFARAPAEEAHLDAGPEQQDFTAAAVLVPLVERRRGIQVILTRRAAHLREHAGQISFPGGRIEHTDASTAAAALREAEEEIRLPPRSVVLTGALPRYRTGTGFVVYPVVGFAEPSTELVPDPAEVAEIFEVPLAFVLDPNNYHPLELISRGRRMAYWAIPYQAYYIWGATAAILRNLCHLLDVQCDFMRAPG
ncbi:MAG: CoA pyrophosphatase [Nitrococcus mobilis]|nr:CoA pyrophosphatase [Nitrococcus mobilis]